MGYTQVIWIENRKYSQQEQSKALKLLCYPGLPCLFGILSKHLFDNVSENTKPFIRLVFSLTNQEGA